MRPQVATPDLAMAQLAASQHGVVSFAQLRSIGLTDSGVMRRARAGRLHRIHRGVYAVGHPSPSPQGRWMAAVLAYLDDPNARREMSADPGTRPIAPIALSHRSAAALWGLLPMGSMPVDVSVSGDGGRQRRRDIRLHRSKTLTPAMVTRRHGIPVTTPARTLADLQSASARTHRGAVSATELRRAVRQASVLGLPIGSEAIADRTRSELEYLFLRLCREHRLPAPEVNVRIGSLEVDFLWRDDKLIVETDGYRYHRGRAAFESDRNRDLALRGLGYEVVRLSYRQVVEAPEKIVAALRTALAQAGDE